VKDDIVKYRQAFLLEIQPRPTGERSSSFRKIVTPLARHYPMPLADAVAIVAAPLVRMPATVRK